MKKVLLLLLLSTSVCAEEKTDALLNKVILPLTAEQWITTKTALVDIGVSAGVSDQGIEKIQNNVMQKLRQFSAKAEWHIISLNRQQDKSGLENIQITAEARMDQSELNGLRDKAKSISKAGETYTVDNIQFTPSDDEVRAANSALREKIYIQANLEIDALNKFYPTQKYYLHKIDFLPMPSIMPMAKNIMYTMQAANVSMTAPLIVGNKTVLQALVELASTNELPAQKIARNEVIKKPIDG